MIYFYIIYIYYSIKYIIGYKVPKYTVYNK